MCRYPSFSTKLKVQSSIWACVAGVLLQQCGYMHLLSNGWSILLAWGTGLKQLNWRRSRGMRLALWSPPCYFTVILPLRHCPHLHWSTVHFTALLKHHLASSWQCTLCEYPCSSYQRSHNLILPVTTGYMASRSRVHDAIIEKCTTNSNRLIEPCVL
jgi:hypothetical protein